MNKIKVVNNKIIPFSDDNIKISNNVIEFTSNGNYSIEYIDCDNVDINFNILDNVCINLFEYSDNKDIAFKTLYNLNNNSSLIVSKFYNNDNTKEDVLINLKEDRANIKYNFSSVSNNDDRYTIDIKHLSRKTSSNIFNRTIAKEGSSNVFDINSYVDNGVRDCYLRQETKIVTLGESDNKINPNMFIGEVSTTAIHSSVVGNINEDDLFYLMSRGISYEDSVNLIIKGMILSNINPDMEMRERILKVLDELGGV